MLEPLARNGDGNQQPELAGMLSNGSETDRASRTDVAAIATAITRRGSQVEYGIVHSIVKTID